MTTSITSTELKWIYLQIVFMAIVGVFMVLYASNPIMAASPGSTATAQTTSADAGGSWILGLIYLPSGMGELFFISALVISPFLLLDVIIALRFVKDITTGWV